MPHRPEGGRRRGGLVAGRHADRLLRARPRRGVRGGGRQEARAAPVHAAPVQARHRSAGRATGGGTSSSSPPTARPRRSSSPTATSRTRIPPGRPTARASRSRRRATRTGTSSSKGDIYVVPADGGEPSRLTPTTASTTRPSYSPDGTQLAVKWAPGGFDFPRHAQIGVVDAVGRERPPPDRLARPQLRPLPGDARADLGRRLDRLRDRGRRQHPPLPRLAGRRRAGARSRAATSSSRATTSRDGVARPHRLDRAEPRRALRRRRRS